MLSCYILYMKPAAEIVTERERHFVSQFASIETSYDKFNNIIF